MATHDHSPIAADPPSRIAALVFCVGIGPAAWALHLIVDYAVASHVCFPGRIPLATAPPGVIGILVAVDAIGLALSGVGAVTARRLIRGDVHRESRTRFLGICGLLASLGFAVAIVFDAIALPVVPLCAS